MCVFCNQGSHNATPTPVRIPPGTTFKSLQLSEADYSARPNGTDGNSERFGTGQNAQIVRVVGFTDDVKDLLNEINAATQANRRDWIEVPYSIMDSVLWIMQRLEKIIRVPMQYWVLAGDGVVYSPGHLVMSQDHFRKKGPIEIILIPAWEVSTYMSTHLKQHTWKHGSTVTPSQLPSNPRERAESLYGLRNPVESPKWAEYITYRQTADKIVQKMMDDMAGDDMDSFLSKLRDSVEQVALEMAENVRIDDEDDDAVDLDMQKIADSVCVMSCDAADDGWGNVPDVECLTRIHSLTSPKSVDVHFSFHHRTRMYSVEWNYCVGFRINHEPAKCIKSYYDPTDFNRQHTQKGWSPIGWFYLDERRSEHSACPIKRQDLQAVQDALFGTDADFGAKIGLKETAMLMLASVGIDFAVADNEADDEDGYTGKYGDGVHLELHSEKPGLSAAHFRKICGIPPLKDDDTADLSCEQVTDGLDDSEEEDCDSEDDDDYGLD